MQKYVKKENEISLTDILQKGLIDPQESLDLKEKIEWFEQIGITCSEFYLLRDVEGNLWCGPRSRVDESLGCININNIVPVTEAGHKFLMKNIRKSTVEPLSEHWKRIICGYEKE